MSRVAELLALPFIARAEKLGSNAGFGEESKRLGGDLSGRGGDDVGRDFHHAGVADFSDHDDFLAARFQHRARLFQSRFISADIINELAIFRRDFAPGERRLEKPRAAPFHDPGGRPHALWSDGAVSGHDVPRREPRSELPHCLE